MMNQKIPFAPCREVKTSVWGGQTLRVGRSVAPCREKRYPVWGVGQLGKGFRFAA